MANRGNHRRFGNVRKLPSGRYQARYPGPDGRLRTAPETFERKKDAEQYLSVVEVQLLRDEWTDPARGQVRLQDYAERWIAERAGLRPRTVQLYEWLLRKNITPYIGGVPIGKITSALVREWRAELLGIGVSQSVAAKSYRLLRAVLMTAVTEDRILARNPCQIKSADRENPEERPTLTVAQVFELAELMPYRKFRAFVLVGAFCSLRWGEITALRRCDVAPDASWIKVGSQFVELVGRGLVRTQPKSRAGCRTVAVPAAIRPDLVEHLSNHVPDRPDALVFTMLQGGSMRRGSFNPLVKWKVQATKVGVPNLRFHDLRHTGNTLAAAGSNIRDLMTRMGHDSPRAALIYLHTTSEADRAIADRLSALVQQHREPSATEPGKKAKKKTGKKAKKDRPGDDEDGSAGALVPAG